jgi:hypothetical protein
LLNVDSEVRAARVEVRRVFLFCEFEHLGSPLSMSARISASVNQ